MILTGWKICKFKKILFFTAYKMKLFSIKTWDINGVEALKHDGKEWVNETHLETALGFKNVASKKT